MKQKLIIFWALMVAFSSHAFAAEDTGLLGGVLPARFREGNITFADIPIIITYVIQWFSQIAGTVALIMIIYGGLRFSLGSLQSDKQKGKEAITWGLIGFVVASLAWVIMNTFLSTLTKFTA